jgi:hypothetical protein
MMELINDLSHSNGSLTKEKSDLLNYINALKEKRRPYVQALEHQPPIPVPPNNGCEIRNEFLGVWRDILLKQTRNPHLTIILMLIYNK